MRISIWFLLIVSCFVLQGCTHVISSAGRAKAVKDLDFITVKNNPDQYLGQTLLLGGLIVEIRLTWTA